MKAALCYSLSQVSGYNPCNTSLYPKCERSQKTKLASPSQSQIWHLSTKSRRRDLSSKKQKICPSCAHANKGIWFHFYAVYSWGITRTSISRSLLLGNSTLNFNVAIFIKRYEILFLHCGRHARKFTLRAEKGQRITRKDMREARLSGEGNLVDTACQEIFYRGAKPISPGYWSAQRL